MQTGDFMRLLDAGVTSDHVARHLAGALRSSGFQELETSVSWGEAVDRPSFARVDGALAAWVPGTGPAWEHGAVVLAAHGDQPALAIKHRSATVSDGLLRVAVEVYGGPIHATWLDRDLAIAGSVIVSADGRHLTRLPVWSRKPVATIPNLAIHLNREINENAHYNRQDHLQAVFAIETDHGSSAEGESSRRFLEFIAKIADVDPATIVDMDLKLVSSEPATMIGERLLSAPRIDNLAGAFTVVEALRAAAAPESHARMIIVFDYEEIGSMSATGAAGALARDLFCRFSGADSPDRYGRMASRSVLISNDVAHARHPNYRDKHDAGYAPRLGGGPVIKRSSVRRYASDLDVIAWLRALCNDAGIPTQDLQNRSDIPAGSTIAPLSSARLGVRSVDVGVALLSMHSIREHIDLTDIELMTRALQAALERGPSEIPHAD